MVWESLKNENVKIVTKDDWCRHGVFLGVVDGFVQLRYADGRVIFIALGEIAVLEPRLT
jgi:hypothetical protein